MRTKQSATVPRRQLEEVLTFIETRTPPQMPYTKWITILQACRTASAGMASWQLSFEQFLEYLDAHPSRRDPAWSAPGTFLRVCSNMSTGLLQPACYCKGWPHRILATALRESRANGTIVFKFAKWHPPFRALLDGFRQQDGKSPDATYHEILRLYHQAGTPEPQPSLPLQETVSGFALRETPPSWDHHAPKAYAASAHEPPRRAARQRVVSESWELTVMTCQLLLPSLADGEDAVQMLTRYRRVLQSACQRFGGDLRYTSPQQIRAYFGLANSSEMHARTAAQAGLRAKEMFQSLRGSDNQKPESPAFQILLHSCTAFVENADGDKPSVTLSPEDESILDGLARLAVANSVTVSQNTLASVRGFYHSRPVESSVSCRGTIVKAHQLVYEHLKPSIFNPSDVSAIPLIGREDDLNALRDAWSSAKGKKPKVVHVQGMMAIGKSRLVHQLLLEVEGAAPKPFIWVCQCWDCHACTPFYPLSQMLKHALKIKWASPKTRSEAIRQLLHEFKLDSEDRAAVLELLVADPATAVLGAVRSPLGQQAFDAAEAGLRYARLPEVIEALLFAIAAETPAILLIEDLHWADASTLQLLNRIVQALGRNQKPMQLLVILTCRTRERPLIDVPRGLSVPIALEHLKEAESRRLLQAVGVARSIHLDEARVAEILNCTGGQPYAIIEEVTREKSPVSFLNKVMHESEGASVADLGEGLIDDHCKTVAQIGAILGRSFTYADIRSAFFLDSDVADEQELQLQHDLSFLVNAEILKAEGNPPQATYQFDAGLMHEMLYNSLSRLEREAKHQYVARMLEQRCADGQYVEPALLGYHYSRAGQAASGKAVYWWHVVARLAMSSCAGGEALAALNKALGFLNASSATSNDQTQALEIWLDKAMVYAMTEGTSSPAMRDAYEKAAEVSQKGVAETTLVFKVRWGHWLLNYIRGNLMMARDMAEALLKLPAYNQDRFCQCEAHHAAWDTLFHVGQLRSALAHQVQCLPMAVELAREQQVQGLAGHAPLVCCLSRSAIGLWGLGCVDQAYGISSKSVTIAKDLKHPNSLAQAYCHAALLDVLCRNWPRAGALASEAADIAKQFALGPRVAMAAVLLAISQALECPDPNTVAPVVDGIARWGETGVRLFQPLWLCMLAELYLAIGDSRAGWAVIEEGLQIASSTGERFYESELYRLRGELRLIRRRRDPVRAESDFRRAIDVAREVELLPLELRAQVSLNRLLKTGKGRKTREARDMLGRMLSRFHQGWDSADVRDARAELLQPK